MYKYHETTSYIIIIATYNVGFILKMRSISYIATYVATTPEISCNSY